MQCLFNGILELFWVYVIINKEAGKRYIGQTENLGRRLAEHNGASINKHRFTSKYAGRWELVHCEKYSTRSESMKREAWLKTGIGREWLDSKIGRASPPQAD
ncbi:GIY-YIG nuclease superfamily protein [Sedimentisphaera salicampi]|uniref:GIY-YIG nuclease superfamily protein n=1 Tax=Sedimentisphaera salicampi TaxID=1941349 RepID=A0A1W6LP82_9BACT|nr:GIY-YIG nuclease superfamily protein [Sedimentisphaera salicampi]